MIVNAMWYAVYRAWAFHISIEVIKPYICSLGPLTLSTLHSLHVETLLWISPFALYYWINAKARQISVSTDLFLYITVQTYFNVMFLLTYIKNLMQPNVMFQ